MSIISLPQLQTQETIPFTHFYSHNRSLHTFSTRYYVGSAGEDSGETGAENNNGKSSNSGIAEQQRQQDQEDFLPVQSVYTSARSHSTKFSSSPQQMHQAVHPMRTFSNSIESLLLDPENIHMLYVGLANGDLLQYNWKEDRIEESSEKRHHASIASLALSTNQQHIISGSDDGTVVISQRSSIKHAIWKGRHSSAVREVRRGEFDLWRRNSEAEASAAPEGRLIIASGRQLVFWDWTEDESSLHEQGTASTFATASGTTHGNSFATQKPFLVLTNRMLNSGVITSFDVHPFRHSIIITGASNGTLTLWDLNLSRDTPLKHFQYNKSPIWKVRFSVEHDVNGQQNYNALYTAHDDGSLLKWEIPQDFSRGIEMRQVVDLVYKHELSSVSDFSLCREDGVNSEDDSDCIVVVTELGAVSKRSLHDAAGNR